MFLSGRLCRLFTTKQRYISLKRHIATKATFKRIEKPTFKTIDKHFPKSFVIERRVNVVKFRNLKDDHWSIASVPILAQFPNAKHLFFENCSSRFIIQNLMSDNTERIEQIALQPHHAASRTYLYLPEQLQEHLAYCTQCKIFSGYQYRAQPLPQQAYYSSYFDYQARWALETMTMHQLYTTSQLKRLLGQAHLHKYLMWMHTDGNELHSGIDIMAYLSDQTNRVISR